MQLDKSGPKNKIKKKNLITVENKVHMKQLAKLFFLGFLSHMKNRHHFLGDFFQI